jgi:hypothetical protein
VNLGFALTIWDQLSGRAVFPTKETIRIDTGLPGRPLAVEQSAPRARHFSVFAAQLLGPFRPMDASPETITGPSEVLSPALAERDGGARIVTEDPLAGAVERRIARQ